MVQEGYGIAAAEKLFRESLTGTDRKPIQFKSNQEYLQAFKTWWINYSSDADNLRDIAKIAYDRFTASNLNHFRDYYRKTWEQETRSRGVQSTQRPPQSASSAAPAVSDVDKQMTDFMGVGNMRR